MSLQIERTRAQNPAGDLRAPRVPGRDPRWRPVPRPSQLSADGWEMHHYLRDGRYQRAVLLGRLALFSIQVGDERATRDVRPVEERGPGGSPLHRLGDRRVAPASERRSGPCLRRSCRPLKELVQQDCPWILPEKEIQRRAPIRDALERSRSFNRDTRIVEKRWERIYRNPHRGVHGGTWGWQ